MNAKVNFKIAVLLKEVGYNLIYHDSSFYNGNYPDSIPLNYYITQENYSSNTEQFAYYYVAPTIAQAVMWIYEKHGIWISVYTMEKWHENGNEMIQYFDYTIKQMKLGLIDFPKKMEEFNSPTEAYLAAIENILKNFEKNLEFTK